MRGMTDHLSIGERIAFYRVRRGYTQDVLAGLVGRSEDWLSKIERGERQIDRLSLLAQLADVLRVELGDLVGQPVLLEVDAEHASVSALRAVLMNPVHLVPRFFMSPTVAAVATVHLDQLWGRAWDAWDTYQAGQLGALTVALPELLRATNEAIRQLDGSDRRSAYGASALVHHTAATSLIKLGEHDLAWIAAERAMSAADSSDDSAVIASTTRCLAHALLALGRYSEAIELATTAAETLQIGLHGEVGTTLYGMLYLRCATAAGRHGDRGEAQEFLERASRAAGELGEDRQDWHTAFGPTNVAMHEVAVSLDLGDVATVLAADHPLADSHMPAERQSSHRIDLAHAHALAGHPDQALDFLLDAEARAPEHVRHHPRAREITRMLLRRSRSRLDPRLRDVAVRCRAMA